MFKEIQVGFDFESCDMVNLESSPHLILDGMVDGKTIVQGNTFVSDINSRGKVISRETNIGDEVDCYRNLNKPSFFSCRQRAGVYKNKVSGYANIIVVESPGFIVSEVSRQRILREKSRNVHAFVRGALFAAYEGKLKEKVDVDLLAVSYSPYLGGSFFRKDTKEPVSREDYRRYAILCGSDVFLTDLNQA